MLGKRRFLSILSVGKKADRPLSPSRLASARRLSIRENGVTLRGLETKTVGNRFPRAAVDPIGTLRTIAITSRDPTASVLIAQNRRWTSAVAAGRQLKLNFGAANLPHPSKAARGGEDAYFAHDNCAGIADGVGGWINLGVDSGLFSRRLLELTAAKLKSDENCDLVTALKCGVEKVDVRGSSTACLIQLKGDVLHVLNLGDSGLIIVRPGSNSPQDALILRRTSTQQHVFNMPFQLGTNCADRPEDAQVFTVKVSPGDIIVMASDGLFDNLFDHEIVNELFAEGVETAQDRAHHLARTAHFVGNSESAYTPFSKEAFKYGIMHAGGKLDDCAVVVAQVELPDGE